MGLGRVEKGGKGRHMGRLTQGWRQGWPYALRPDPKLHPQPSQPYSPRISTSNFTGAELSNLIGEAATQHRVRGINSLSSELCCSQTELCTRYGKACWPPFSSMGQDRAAHVLLSPVAWDFENCSMHPLYEDTWNVYSTFPHPQELYIHHLNNL